jgi:hypothetical protein
VLLRSLRRAAVVAAVGAAFACSATAVSAAVPNWSAGGFGWLQVTTAPNGTSTFSYDAFNDSAQFDGLWWTFLTTAPVTGQLTYTYNFTGCHSWYQSDAQLYATVDRNGGRVSTQRLVATGGCSFGASGTATFDVQAGDVYGFWIWGRHYDGSRLMRGSLSVTPVDTTPPVITHTVSGTLGDGGWYTSDAAVSFSVSDPESAVTSTGGCSDTTVSADTAGTTYTCTAISAGGTNSDSVTVKRDATPPEIAFSGNAGTYTVAQTVAITCNASDALSGVASSTCPNVASGTGWSLGLGSHTVTATASDTAGNTSTEDTSFTVTVDPTSLATLVGQLSTNGGVASGLDSKLAAIAGAISRGQDKTTSNLVNAFDNQVDAQTGKAFTSEQAKLLKSLAAAL